MSNWLTKALGSMKLRTEEMRWPGQSLVMFDLGSSVDDLAIERWIGDGTEADIVMTPIRWLQRAIVEAPLLSELKTGAGPTQKILDKPNAFYTLEHLLAATVYSLAIDGNAYWIVLRNASGIPVELWWAPHTMVEPMWPDDGSAYLTYYAYSPGGAKQRVELADMLHFRDGLDPRNPRKGLSPLRSLLREVWADREASKFTGALLRNGGVPGLVISPKAGAQPPTPEQAKAIKDRIDSGFTGSERGRTLVLAGSVELDQFGFSPKDLDLSPLRDISEERVSAALGIPAAVLGWGAGLQQTKVGATMRELRQLAWWQSVIPLQKIIAAEIERVLGKGERVSFDVDSVEALSENSDIKAARVERLLRAGALTRAEARTELGYESTNADNVYLLPMSTLEVPAIGARQGSSGGKGLKSLAVENARHRAVPASLRGLVNELDRIRLQDASLFEEPLRELFDRMGSEAERVALELLTPKEISVEDQRLVDGVLEALSQHRHSLSEIYSGAYLASTRNVLRAMGRAYGVEIALSDPGEVEILRRATVRAGLVDLNEQSREALFQALADGREAGLANEGLARSIRQYVSGGPWRDAATRARVIARTEGAYATNIATIQAAQEMPGTELMMLHDNRTGYGDADCTARDGIVVTIAQAEAEAGNEHPNGTLNMTPIPALLAEEMGL